MILLLKMNCVYTTVTLLEERSERHFLAALPNGKRIMAHRRRGAEGEAPPYYQPGDRVTAKLNLYDFSKAQLEPEVELTAADQIAECSARVRK